MKVSNVLLLSSPMVDLQIDMKSVAPDYAVATTKKQVFKAIEDTKNHDAQEHKPLHYLGVAGCYGFHQCRFVIRALGYEHAFAIIRYYLNRINSSEQMQEKLQQGSTLFKGGLVSDKEASKSELHNFIESASTSPGPLIVLY